MKHMRRITLAAALALGFAAMSASAHPSAEQMYANCVVCCLADGETVEDAKVRRETCKGRCSKIVREVIEGWNEWMKTLRGDG